MLKIMKQTMISVMGITLLASGLVHAADPIKIALVHGTTGHPFEVFSKQAQTGFMLGLEYATGGTMSVKGHKIEVIRKDTQFKPDIARAVLAEAYGDDDVVLLSAPRLPE